MEVISLHVGIISRRKGRSSVQIAAYCSRSKLHDEYTGKTYDYTDRNDLIYHNVMLPDCAPDGFHDSAILWNDVERIEKARNSRLARALTIALPKELGHDAHINMVRQYAQKFFVHRGMCADISIHDKGDGNPHTHILLTTRSMTNNGEWTFKQQRNYLLDKNGERIRDPVTHRFKLGRSIKANDWDSPERIEEWRKGWAETCQSWFEQYGIHKEVTHLSFAKQGIDREPTIHLGAKVKALEARGLQTDRGKKNRSIVEHNHALERMALRERTEIEHIREIERDR